MFNIILLIKIKRGLNMNKMILICFFMLLNSPLYADIYGNIEFGKDTKEDQIYYSTINLGYRFNIWKITSETYGGWFTWQEIKYPFVQIYSYNQKLKFNGFYIKYSHYCSHKVISDSSDKKFNNTNLFKKYGSNPQALTTISIGYEFEY